MAIINIGSGSVKLFLQKTNKTYAKVTLLASYSDKNKAALDDTFNAVAYFYDLAKKQGEQVYIFGTESMRQIDSTLSDRIFDSLDKRVDIISGKTEALCGFLGCKNDYDVKTAVIDVGGASTELSVGVNSCDFLLSLPIGSVALYNHFKVDSTNDDSFFDLLKNYINNFFADLPLREFLNTKTVRLIGGTAINLAAVLLNQKTLDLNAVDKMAMDRNTILPLVKSLLCLDVSKRVTRFPFLEEKRALVLPYGISIIYCLLSLLPDANVQISKTGLIEGYIKLMAL